MIHDNSQYLHTSYLHYVTKHWLHDLLFFGADIQHSLVFWRRKIGNGGYIRRLTCGRCCCCCCCCCWVMTAKWCAGNKKHSEFISFDCTKRHISYLPLFLDILAWWKIPRPDKTKVTAWEVSIPYHKKGVQFWLVVGSIGIPIESNPHRIV